ncbi:hypothetical protein OF846_003964 [Rhodotorula toruloides]|nr:hypothetical protein OF846_003964 [Rhodotorula toruloides]
MPRPLEPSPLFPSFLSRLASQVTQDAQERSRPSPPASSFPPFSALHIAANVSGPSQDVYHGWHGMSVNPQASPAQQAYAREQMAQTSSHFHGHHGAAHNETAGDQAKSNAMHGMQQTQPDAWKNR